MNNFIEIKKPSGKSFLIDWAELPTIIGTRRYFKSDTKSGYPIFSITIYTHEAGKTTVTTSEKTGKNKWWTRSGIPNKLISKLIEMLNDTKEIDYVDDTKLFEADEECNKRYKITLKNLKG